MKKFIVFIITAIILAVATSSCATTKTYITETYGDVQLLNYQGQTIRAWDNAVIESETTTLVESPFIINETSPYNVQRGIKLGGALNFKDEDGIYHYINGGIIIVDNLTSNTIVDNLTSNTKKKETPEQIQLRAEKEKKIAEYHKVSDELKYFEKEIKKFHKNTKDYDNLKEKITQLRTNKKEMEKTLWKEYKYAEPNYK